MFHFAKRKKLTYTYINWSVLGPKVKKQTKKPTWNLLFPVDTTEEEGKKLIFYFKKAEQNRTE